MNTPSAPSDDPLETLLKKNAAPIADDGFTSRVLTSLPAPAPQPKRMLDRRLIACIVGGLVGVLCAIQTSGLPQPRDLEAAGAVWINWATKLTESGDKLVPLATSAAVIAASLAIAFSRQIATRVKALDLF